jgi:hypothetical protein
MVTVLPQLLLAADRRVMVLVLLLAADQTAKLPQM